jgi:hypothetical protein
LQALARHEAIIQLLSEWLDGQDIVSAMTELTTEEERGELSLGGGKSHRLTTSRRVAAVLDQLHRVEVRAAHERSRLGLDPVSRVKLKGSLDRAPFDLALYWAQRAEERDAAEGG